MNKSQNISQKIFCGKLFDVFKNYFMFGIFCVTRYGYVVYKSTIENHSGALRCAKEAPGMMLSKKSFFPLNEKSRPYSFATWRILCTVRGPVVRYFFPGVFGRYQDIRYGVGLLSGPIPTHIWQPSHLGTGEWIRMGFLL